MSTPKRRYRSEARQAKAELTRRRILTAARKVFAKRGFERATIGELADLAGVSASLIYALFKSKEGVLRALIDSTVFGRDYKALVDSVAAQNDPREILNTAASITRLIYDAEIRELGPVHRAGIVSTRLRKLERDLEKQRYERQQIVVRRLVDAAALRRELGVDAARDILWSLTSGELYRLLVRERKWTADEYEKWLGALLAAALLHRVDQTALT
jgi:AcrR family transcriptional regulator